MQKFLFNDPETGTTVANHVKHMLTRRFKMYDVPDSFLFMPETLGGLGLKNPFISLLLLWNDICKDPEKRMQKFHTQEREEYNDAKKEFEALSDKERRKRYKAAFQDDEDDETEPPISWKDAQTFMTFEDFVKYRECTSQKLYDVYTYFLQQPRPEGVVRTDRFKNGLKGLKHVPEGLDSNSGGKMDPEIAWTVQFFEDELFEKSGGLEVVDKALLPMGVLKVLTARKVTWQMVL